MTWSLRILRGRQISRPHLPSFGVDPSLWITLTTSTSLSTDAKRWPITVVFVSLWLTSTCAVGVKHRTGMPAVSSLYEKLPTLLSGCAIKELMAFHLQVWSQGTVRQEWHWWVRLSYCRRCVVGSWSNLSQSPGEMICFCNKILCKPDALICGSRSYWNTLCRVAHFRCDPFIYCRVIHIL